MTEAPTTPPADDGGGSAAPPGIGGELRALRRSRSDRVVAGVLGGLGRRLGIDPLLLRIVTVVLAIFGGIGVLAYAAAWLLIPAEDEEASVAEQALGRHDAGSPRTATVALALGLTLVALLAGGGIVGGDWDGGVLLLLAALGLAVLFRRDDRQAAAEPAASPDDSSHPTTSFTDYPGYPGYPGSTSATPSVTAPVDGESATGATSGGGETAQADTTDTIVGDDAGADAPDGDTSDAPAVAGDIAGPADTESAGPSRWWTEEQAREAGQQAWPADDTSWDPYAEPETAPEPRRPRSVLGPITVSAAAVAVGSLAVSDATWAEVPPATYVATALAVVGLGLLLGTWWGRSRGLIALGIALSVALAPAVAVDRLGFDGTDVTFRPTTLAELPTGTQDYGAGSVHYDLSGLDFANADAESLSVDMGVGELLVIVPPNVDVEVNGDVGVGELRAFGQMSGGFGQETRVIDVGGDGKGGGSLALNLDLGVGSLEVRREAP